MPTTMRRQFKLLANGIQDEKGRFFPFQRFTFVLSALTMNPAPSVHARIYVHRVMVALRMAAADTTTSVNLSGTVEHVYASLFRIQTVPSVAQVVNTQVDVNTLLDPGKFPDMQTGGGDPTICAMTMWYAEVPNDV